MTYKVLITCPPMLQTIGFCEERFKQEGLEIVAPKFTQQLSEDELCDLIGDVDGVIAGDDPYTKQVLEIGKAGKLKALAKWGIGVDAIDLKAAKELGIKTSNTPDVFGNEVADVVIGYTAMLARQLHIINEAAHKGEWIKIQGTSLYGKTAGIIGFGSIGREVAKRYKSMGLNVLGYDIKSIKEEYKKDGIVSEVSLEALLKNSDIVVLACVLTADNVHLLDENEFSLMKDNVFIINVARGALINEKALILNLDSGKISGAALDVFEIEPVSINNPLTEYKQVIMGSHNASNTSEAVIRVNQMAIDNLLRDLKE